MQITGINQGCFGHLFCNTPCREMHDIDDIEKRNIHVDIIQLSVSKNMRINHG